MSSQQARDTDVFVEIGPLNRVSTAQQLPMGPFRLGCLRQTGPAVANDVAGNNRTSRTSARNRL
jgi:hypothetical protein